MQIIKNDSEFSAQAVGHYLHNLEVAGRAFINAIQKLEDQLRLIERQRRFNRVLFWTVVGLISITILISKI